MLDSVVDFFNHPFFIIFGGISVSVSIIFSLYVICIVTKGIVPVWYRLGIALSGRKIAIFAEGGDFNNLRNVLVDSQLFKEKNIKGIDKNSISAVESESLFLVHWKSYKEYIDQILQRKKDTTALIVYAPTEEGRIDDKILEKMSKLRSVTVVNFRGRLINDVLICMMTSRKE